MKQHITVNQLDELSERGKERLRKWWKPKEGDQFVRYFKLDNSNRQETYYISWNDGYEDNINDNDSLPLLSIGQMIEFLEEHSKEGWENVIGIWENVIGIDEYDVCLDYRNSNQEFCDALWEAIKEVLEK